MRGGGAPIGARALDYSQGLPGLLDRASLDRQARRTSGCIWRLSARHATFRLVAFNGLTDLLAS